MAPSSSGTDGIGQRKRRENEHLQTLLPLRAAEKLMPFSLQYTGMSSSLFKILFFGKTVKHGEI